MIKQITGFTRQEAIQLTNCTSSRIAYLEKIGLVIPTRHGTIGGKPTVIFSYGQLLGIQAVRELRLEEVPLLTVKRLVTFLENANHADISKDKLLIAMNEDIFWVQNDWSDFATNMPKGLKKASKENKNISWYTLIVIPIGDIINAIFNMAKNSEAINLQDFQQRINN